MIAYVAAARLVFVPVPGAVDDPKMAV